MQLNKLSYICTKKYYPVIQRELDRLIYAGIERSPKCVMLQKKKQSRTLCMMVLFVIGKWIYLHICFI